MLLEKQKMIFDKGGLGFNTLTKQKYLKYVFIKSSFEKHTITHFKYNKIDHKAIDCNINKFINIKMK